MVPLSRHSSIILSKVVSGWMTRWPRFTSLQACLGHARAHTPQPRHSSVFTFASCFLFDLPFPAGDMAMALMGQALAHFPHPTQVSSSIPAMKFEVTIVLV